MSDRYGEYEQVNGAVCNDLIDRIEKLEAWIEAVKAECDRTLNENEGVSNIKWALKDVLKALEQSDG